MCHHVDDEDALSLLKSTHTLLQKNKQLTHGPNLILFFFSLLQISQSTNIEKTPPPLLFLNLNFLAIRIIKVTKVLQHHCKILDSEIISKNYREKHSNDLLIHILFITEKITESITYT